MVRAARREYDPARLEAEVRDLWQKEGTYAEARRLRAGGPKWYFIDGPPYATGHIHLGTAWNKALKDAVVRYKAMRGFAVRDQPGFDMHGLPIEVKVEKDLGITSKKQIEERGVEDFVGRCRQFALDHLAIMTDEFKELGVWLDWDHPYRTIDNSYIEGAWWALAEAHRRELLYEAERVLTWCWRCETALAAAEIEYEERKDPSIYVRFPLAERAGESLLVWTTTPWTLPANVAVAANPELSYARVRFTKGGASEILVLVHDEARIEDARKLGGFDAAEVVEVVPGGRLEGWRYVHPFRDEVPRHRAPPGKEQTILLGEHVAGDRTGLVHTATGHGAEDFEVGARYGIPPFSPVGEDGRYTDAAGALAGLRVKGAASDDESADKRVVALLQAKGLLLKYREEKHAYGHCWRCKNPIVYRATRQWFLDIGKVKDRMLAETARVDWTPEWAGSARQADWVRQARDWCISRQRYWGIPLPVWRCGQGCTRVVGRAAELQGAEGYQPGMDLHRPWIDRVTPRCDAHGEPMRRAPDVLDVWFDSAVAAWAQLGWPSRGDAFEKWFPCDFIVEGLDQTRGWFYSQLAAGVSSMDRVPYERVLMHGFVHDDQGRPMSKSLGNIVPPHDVVVKHGADAFRFHVLSVCAPWEDIHFGWDGVRNTERALNILWNVHVFGTQYMALDRWRPTKAAVATRDEDRWLRSRVATVVEAVTREMEALHIHRAAREIERFVLEDLSRWYVRLVRDRAWADGDDASKLAMYATLHHALSTTSRLLAPFAPFVADAMYRDLGGARASVHHEDWPVAGQADRDPSLEADMAVARAVVDAAASARQQAQMKLRWPVARLTVATDDARVRDALARFGELVREQANAKAVDVVPPDWEGLEIEAVPNKNLIGKTFRAQGPVVLAALRDASQADLKSLRRAAREGRPHVLSLGSGAIEVTPEMVTFQTRVPPTLAGEAFDVALPAEVAPQGVEAIESQARAKGAVYVDTVVTPELEAEGWAREIVRRIQEMRKELNLAVTAEIRVEIALDDRLRAVVALHSDDIAHEVRAKHLSFVGAPQGRVVKDWDVEGQKVRIGIL